VLAFGTRLHPGKAPRDRTPLLRALGQAQIAKQVLHQPQRPDLAVELAEERRIIAVEGQAGHVQRQHRAVQLEVAALVGHASLQLITQERDLC